MKKWKEFTAGLINNVGFGIKICYLASGKFFVYKCLMLLIATFFPLLSMQVWKEILNGITSGEGVAERIFVFFGMYAALKLAVYLLSPLQEYVNFRYGRELQFYMDDVMIQKIAHIDLAFFDSATMGDKVNRVRNNFNTVHNMTWTLFNLLSSAVSTAAILVIVCLYRPWFGLLSLLLLIPFIIYNKKHADKRLRMESEQLRDRRKQQWYGDVFFNDTMQFELKLNHTGAYFIKQYKALWSSLYKINKREDIRHNVINAGMLLFNVSGELIVLGLSVADVIAGTIGIGDLQYNLNMVTRLREQLTGLVENTNTLLNDNTRLRELQDFIALKTEREKNGTKLPSEHPRIAFSHVSFRYPNCEEYVLKDCSFVIEPHEKVGLIGVNGAGKSTIIKLMFRFYDPEEGCILLDGVDLREYDIYAVRKVFGVLFQDYVTYSLSLREIIALSDFGERFNDAKLDRACKISGADQVIKDWEEGYDQILGNAYVDDGKRLSGGQWQLMGLARAYFKESKYRILDEPSAALDPISEDRIFEQMHRLSGDSTSVTISHRLSNTTLADKILVIEDGKIIEQGSHEELLKFGGRYAYLFGLQASRYA